MTTRPQASPWTWVLLGAVVGLLSSTLVNAPARWLTSALQQAALDRVLFQEVRGTVWRGSARLTLTGGAGSTAAATLPGRLSWWIHPSWSGLLVDVQADCCIQVPWRFSWQPRWRGATLAVADGQSSWPAPWLAGLGTPWNTVQAEGALNLSTQGLSMAWRAGRMVLAGHAQLDALQISSRLSTLRPMGSYRLAVQGGENPALTLETLQGDLQLQGSGQWLGSRLRFDGAASAAPERQAALSNLLNIIGRRDGVRAIIKMD